MPMLEDVALSIASVMTNEEKDQLKRFVTAELTTRSYILFARTSSEDILLRQEASADEQPQVHRRHSRPN